MAQHLTEEEQLEMVKRWWQENGRALIVGVVVAIVAYFGWQTWQTQRQQARENASVLYDDLMETVIAEPGQALTDDQILSVQSIASELKSDHGDTFYATTAALFLAKLEVERGQLAAAETELRWAVEHAADAMMPVARLRLARVLYAQDKFAEALTELDAINAEGFTASVAELRGDILAAQGDTAGARVAYQTALDELLPAQGNLRNIIQMKMTDLAATSTATATDTGAES